ncbi:MAG: Gfo/Idh/MocA family oxidoreductase [Tannerellaceae bacterium]|nr:Gfo/Idh/MocA family oxidoreductase [Tannerellaceae bacterium]
MKQDGTKVRFGVIGTNYITGKMLAGAKEDERFILTAVCSRTKTRGETFVQEQGYSLEKDGVKVFTSVEEMAESPVVDAVYVASPNSLHAQQSIACMKQGKHVLCEKPLASNVTEASAMIAASLQYNVTLMEAMKPTLTPNFLALRDNIHRIGKIRRYFSCYCQYSSRYDDLKNGIVQNAFNPALSNGAMSDIGVYTVYPMVVLFGYPKRIEATGLLLSSGTDGQGAINFLYDEMMGTVLYSKIADSSLPTEFQGEEGTITLDRINIISRLTLTSRSGRAVETLTRPVEKNEFYYEVSEFINLLLAGKRESSINSHSNSLNTIRIIDEVRRQLGVAYPADAHLLQG